MTLIEFRHHVFAPLKARPKLAQRQVYTERHGYLEECAGIRMTTAAQSHDVSC